jgi:hypothetical protein
MITPTQFQRIPSDANGNPRYVTHFLNIETANHYPALGLSTISERYTDALRFARNAGGKKYHNKKFGGGIAFQSYALDELCNFLNNFKG